MHRPCPHCSEAIPEAAFTSAPHRCLRCGGALAGGPVLAPAVTAAHRGQQRNLRLLGAAALLLLGGVAAFLVLRPGGDRSRRRETVIDRSTNNEYFTRLIASGETTAEVLSAFVKVQPYGSGFIGISKDPLPWRAAQELAARAGGEVLEVAVTGETSRGELLGWIARSFPALQGLTSWVHDHRASEINERARSSPGRGGWARGVGTIKTVDAPDVLDATSLEQPRHVFVHWPRTEWVDHGWSWTLPAKFDQVTPFSSWGLARVRVGAHWGVIDEKGAWVQEPAFDWIEPFAEQGTGRLMGSGASSGEREPFGNQGSARFRLQGKWGVLDRTGKVIAQPEWDEVQPFINGFVPVRRDGKWGYLDASGKLAIPCEWDDAWRFTPEGFAIVTRAGKRGYIDRSGKIVIEPVWEGAVNFSKEGLALVRGGGGWALVDTSGRLRGDPSWGTRWQESVFTQAFQGWGGDGKARWTERRFDLGFLPFGGKPKWSLLGIDGNPVPESEADFIANYGPAISVRSKGQGNLIGAEGKVLFHAGGIINGIQFATGEPQVTGFLDSQGKVVLPPSPGMKERLGDRFLKFESGKKWGVADLSGKVIVAPEWDAIEDRPPHQPLGDDPIGVRRGDKWGFVDQAGKILAEPQWREIGEFSEGFAAVRQEQPAIDAPRPPGSAKSGLNPRHDAQIPITWAFIDRAGKPAFAGRSWDMSQWRGVYSFRRLESPRFLDGQLEFLPPAGLALKAEQEGVRFSTITGRFVPQPKLSILVDTRGREKAGRRLPPATADYTQHTGGVALALRKPFSLYHDRYGEPANDAWLVDGSGAVMMTGLNWQAGDPDLPFGDFLPYALPAKVGLIDVSGKIIVPPTWDEVRVLSPSLVWFRIGAKCGLADQTGQVIIAPAWDELEVLPVDSGSLGADGQTVLLGRQGTPILAPWVRVVDGGTVKILQLDGAPAIPEQLAGQEYVDFYGPAHLLLRKPDGQGGYVWSLYEPKTGDQVVFTEASAFRWNWNMARAGVIWMKDKTTAEWRLFSRQAHDFGQRQPEVEKPDGWGFVEGRGLLHRPDGWSFVDTAIQPISPEKWEKARDFSEGRAAVLRDGKWGFLGLDGKLALPAIWEDALDFSRGLAAVRKDGRWGYLDPQGKMVIEAVWDQAQSFRSWVGEPTAEGAEVALDIAEVRINNAAAVIDRQGRLVVDPQQNYLRRNQSAYYNGRARLVVAPRAGAPAVIPLAWKQVREASPTRGWQAVDGTLEGSNWQLIDEAGRPLGDRTWEKPAYDLQADPLAGGLLTVRTPQLQYGLVRRDGSVAVEPQFDRIAWVAPKVAAVWGAQGGGLIDATGRWLFRDTEQIRIARFGAKDSRQSEADFRHGLVAIENVPKWGYARLNRRETPASRQP